jgi:PleD family two-component response regulator
MPIVAKLAKLRIVSHCQMMVKPLALVIYENLLPGTQLVNRLRDLGYRVQVLQDPKTLITTAIEEKPLVVLADLDCQSGELSTVLSQLRETESTSHIPVLAFSDNRKSHSDGAVSGSGINLVASPQAILAQLPELLDQVLQVE